MKGPALALTLLCSTPLLADTGIAIDGRALGPDGRGMAGARVELRPVLSRYEQGIREAEGTGEPAPEVTAVTREDGRFRLAAPRPGMWTVTVRAAGSVPVRVPLLPLLEPAALPNAVLQRDAGLRVRVEDVEGHPIPGARVIGEAAKGETTWQPLPRRAVAGPDGEVHLARVDGERLRVWAVAEGFAVAESEPENKSRPGEGPKARAPLAQGNALGGAPEATLRLRRLPPREIVVQEADGSAPSGVVVREARSGLVLGLIRPGRERTEIPIAAGTALLLETADGRRAPLVPRAVLAVRLPASAPGSGRVLDPQRHAIQGAWVWPSEEPALAVRSDVQGAYRLPAAILTDGLQAAAADFQATSLERAPRFGRDLPAVTLWPTASVTGTVVDPQGRPVEGALVLIPNESRAWTSAAGAFRLSGLSAGSLYGLTASHPRFGVARAAVEGKAAGVRVVLRPGASVTGTVVDDEGRPVPEIEVEIVRPTEMGPENRPENRPESLGRTRADAEGRFIVPSLPSGPAALRIRRTGALPFERPGIEVPGSGTADLGRIVLPNGAALTGRVLDPDGNPLPGAEVWKADLENFEAPWPDQPSAVAGPDGGFTIGGLPSGPVQLAACHIGSFPQKTFWGDVPPEPVAITLDLASRLTGTVVDPEGRPVAKARVLAIRPAFHEGQGDALAALDHPPCGNGEETVLTDAEGRFTVAPLEPDLYILSVEADGFLPRRIADTEVRREGQADLAIALERGASLSGRVTDPRGEPIEGASISGSEAIDTHVETDADGRYRIEGIETGTVNLSVSHPGFEIGSPNVEIAAGENTFDVQLEPDRSGEDTSARYEVRGRVLDPQGGPVANARVTTVIDNSTATGPDGSFALRLDDGAYSIQAEADGWSPGWTEKDVVVDGAPVSGVEIRLGNGAELTGRLLGLEPGDTAWARVSADGVDGTVAADGSYRVGPLRPGTWSVTAQAAGDRQAEGEAVVEPGSRGATLDLRFPSQSLVSGRAVDPDGAPVPAADLSFHSDRLDTSFWVTTRSDGTFEIRLEDGTYTVDADPRLVLREKPAVVVAGAPVADLEVRLGREVHLTVRVTGIPPEEIRELDFQKPGTLGLAFRLPRTPDGVYSTKGLSPGTWKVTAERTGEHDPQSTEMEVEIDGRQDRTVEMRWP
jgi:protocatechuate 3,4-dioxygenase beta subunit